MGGRSFPRVPVNPRLEFGLPLDQVCEYGELHPGLRELFLKAYLNASEKDDHDRSPPVLEALKSGPNGQGLVSERMSLKSKLEVGNWIVATPTPPGAPLWLLRHFLGRLPQPLLQGPHWRMLAIACGTVLRSKAKGHLSEVLSQIVTALEALPLQHYLTLVALVLLVRNLSMEKQPNRMATLHEEALDALSQYFIASIITRPYRPGLYTALDREHKPLLLFISEYWPEIRKTCMRRATSNRRKRRELQRKFVNRTGRINLDKPLIDKSEEANEKVESKSTNVENENPSICDPDDQFGSKQFLTTQDEEKEKEKEKNKREDKVDDETTLKTIRAPIGVEFGPYVDKDIQKMNDNLWIQKKSVPEIIKEIDLPKKNELLQEDRGSDSFLNTPEVSKDIRRNNMQFLGARKIMADENNGNSKIYTKRLIKRYEDDSPRRRSNFGKSPERETLQDRHVTKKMNGTQTFECEFLEIESYDDLKIIESAKTAAFSSTIEREIEARKSKTKNILMPAKDTAIIDIRKIEDNGATLPLTRTIATLMKHLPTYTNEKEVIVILPKAGLEISENSTQDNISKYRFDNLNATESVFFSFPNSDISTMTLKTVTLERNDQSLEKNSRILKQNNCVSFEKAQKKSSVYNDFVTELKSNFKNGWKKPSEARLVNTMKKVDKDDGNVDQRVFNVQRLAKLLRDRMSALRDMGSSGSVQELIPRETPDLDSPTNSI